jgi:hypothetical protein
MTKFLGGQNEFAFVGIFFWAKNQNQTSSALKKTISIWFEIKPIC